MTYLRHREWNFLILENELTWRVAFVFQNLFEPHQAGWLVPVDAKLQQLWWWCLPSAIAILFPCWFSGVFAYKSFAYVHKSLVIWRFPVYQVYTPRACIIFTSISIDTWSGKERIWSCVNWWRDSCEYTLGTSNIHSSQRLEEPLRTERSRFSSNSPMAKRKNQNDWQWLRK